MNNKGQIGFITGIFALFLLLTIFFIIFSITGLQVIITENGKYTGYVTAIETNGIFYKTDSVYLKSDTESTQEERFCVLDKEIKKELEVYQESREMITLEFYDVFLYGWNSCKTDDTAIISGITKAPTKSAEDKEAGG